MRKLILVLVVAVPISCHTPSTTQLSELPEVDPDAPPSGNHRVTVDALIFDNFVYPVAQFRNITGAECEQQPHWHSEETVAAIGLLGREPTGQELFHCNILLRPGSEPECREDPDFHGCGHGKVSEVTRRQVQVFQRCLDAFEAVKCP